MNEDAIKALLVTAMSYDNRKPGQAMTAAWLDAAQRGRWHFPAASEAIRAHYAESTEFVMPAHITRRIRLMREDAAMRALTEAPSEPDPEAAARHQALVDRVMGWRRTRSDPARGALGVACPHCGAAVRSACTRPARGGPVPTNPHPSRVAAAIAARRAS